LTITASEDEFFDKQKKIYESESMKRKTPLLLLGKWFFSQLE
jgi:hypothetical protein